MIHPTQSPSLVFSDADGNIIDFPSLNMAGMANGHYISPSLEDLIPLPNGSELFVLPQRHPVAIEPETGEAVLVSEDPYGSGSAVQAVGAFMAPAHTSMLSTAYQSQKDAPTLPLFAYTAVGWWDNQFWVAGFRSDADTRQDCDQYTQEKVVKCTRILLKKYQDNRLVQHLGKCCLTYGCPAARNYFLGRWEAPLPTSPQCNARCVGCISLQESGCCPATQDRIKFVPTASEIAEMATDHLQSASKAIVSFGQGCEGEPLLQASTLEKAIVKIRRSTDKGTINLNSNGSLPAAIKRLRSAGLDSLRVSVNSLQKAYYTRYYRPKNYSFEDVLDSIKVMKSLGGFVSLNYFILPGFTDTPEEQDQLFHIIEKFDVDCIQLRNLNMDPEWYLQVLEFSHATKPTGVSRWLGQLKETFPQLHLGYFNPPLQ